MTDRLFASGVLAIALAVGNSPAADPPPAAPPPPKASPYLPAVPAYAFPPEAFPAYLATRFWQAERQRTAVAALERLGVSVSYDYQSQPPAPALLRRLLGEDFFRNAVHVSLYGKQLAAADLRPLEELPRLRTVFLVDAGLEDGALAHLASLGHLEVLALGGNKLTDDGLRHLGRLSQLRALSLTGNPVTAKGLAHLRAPKLAKLFLSGTKIDDGLAPLAEFPALEMLELGATAVGDAGAAQLKQLKGLKYLGLCQTKVSDRALPDLMELKGLTELQVIGSAVTRDGAGRLRIALPNCNVR